ncbi:MAG TPA: DUF2157 domain-containing protein [Methylomirabilota bacterium]|nr:DUF2157 domain-containing protein [Methylomirabilota bacterium]
MDVTPEVRTQILRDGIQAWRASGTLTADDSERLLRTLASAPAPRRAAVNERKLGRGVTILVNLGAIALGAGLVVFFAGNWMEFGRAAKIASLVGLTLLFYVAGFELIRGSRWGFPKLGLALVFLGCVMFGTDLVLLGLMYDLTAEHAWSLLLQGAAWLSVAYVVRSRLVLFLALIGVVAWFGAEVGYCWGGYWLYLGRPFHFIGVGAALMAIGGLHGRRGWRDFGAAWALVGLLLVYLSVLILSIFDVGRMFRLDASTAPWLVWALFVAPYVLAVTAMVAIYLGGGASVGDAPTLLVLFLLVLATLASVIATTPHSRAVWFILLLSLLTSAGIYVGIAWESAVFLNTSLVFFAINLYTRFYEYFWDAMPKSLFFIVGGAALILGGVWVERLRRRVIRQFAAAAA